MNKYILILAGGQGSRMQSDLPKVLIPVNGRPMVLRLLDTIERLQYEEKPVVVVGFESEKVKAAIGDRARFSFQAKQLGTGHAVSCAREHVAGTSGATLVLYGDHPYVSEETITSLFFNHEQGGAVITLMTTTVPHFKEWYIGFEKYGRIIRDADGIISHIQEFADCSNKEKLITEVNPGYYCFDNQWLWEHIDLLQSNNNQHELYLTDLIALAVQQGERINSIAVDSKECLGINTMEQKELLELLMK